MSSNDGASVYSLAPKHDRHTGVISASDRTAKETVRERKKEIKRFLGVIGPLLPTNASDAGVNKGGANEGEAQG